MTRPTFTLPLLSPASSTPDWHGFTVDSLEGVAAPPEPQAPQGEYATSGSLLSVPLTVGEHRGRSVELLAPAGGPDAAFAAFHLGTDAIYLGLKKFSARAEAENFTLDEL